MKNIILLILFVSSNELLAQCKRDTIINGNINVQYIFNAHDSSANLNVQFSSGELGSKEFYYDSNECNFVPKIISKLNDSTLLFLHGKGQTYRVITVVANRNKHVNIESFENEIFYRNESGDEKMLFIVDRRPYLIQMDGEQFLIKKYKSDISNINSGFSIYKSCAKLPNDNGKLKTLKYSSFR